MLSDAPVAFYPCKNQNFALIYDCVSQRHVKLFFGHFLYNKIGYIAPMDFKPLMKLPMTHGGLNFYNQGALNQMEIRLNLCNIFSILKFSK